MAYPISVNKNNYFENRKKSTVETPLALANFIYQIIKDGGKIYSDVWDIGCYKGNLSYPWKVAGHTCRGVDIKDHGYHSEIQIGDFLNINPKEFTDACGHYAFKPDAIFLCNPPFNHEFEGKRAGRSFLPELFLKQIFDLSSYNYPVVLIVPMGCRLNNRKKSTRWRWLRDCGASITSIITLPLDIFPEVQFHTEILFFNMPQLKPHYFLTEDALK